jgi:threonine aldolase
VGAVLAASGELIEEAWRYKQMIGGAMRQAGVLAAAALYALDHHVERLAEDHAHAHRLASGLAEIEGVRIDVARVETNIVVFGVDSAYEVCERLWERGVQVAPLGPDRLRAVTHLDVSAAGVEDALEAFRQVVGGLGS